MLKNTLKFKIFFLYIVGLNSTTPNNNIFFWDNCKSKINSWSKTTSDFFNTKLVIDKKKAVEELQDKQKKINDIEKISDPVKRKEEIDKILIFPSYCKVILAEATNNFTFSSMFSTGFTASCLYFSNPYVQITNLVNYVITAIREYNKSIDKNKHLTIKDEDKSSFITKILAKYYIDFEKKHQLEINLLESLKNIIKNNNNKELNLKDVFKQIDDNSNIKNFLNNKAISDKDKQDFIKELKNSIEGLYFAKHRNVTNVDKLLKKTELEKNLEKFINNHKNEQHWLLYCTNSTIFINRLCLLFSLVNFVSPEGIIDGITNLSENKDIIRSFISASGGFIYDFVMNSIRTFGFFKGNTNVKELTNYILDDNNQNTPTPSPTSTNPSNPNHKTLDEQIEDEKKEIKDIEDKIKNLENEANKDSLQKDLERRKENALNLLKKENGEEYNNAKKNIKDLTGDNKKYREIIIKYEYDKKNIELNIEYENNEDKKQKFYEELIKLKKQFYNDKIEILEKLIENKDINKISNNQLETFQNELNEAKENSLNLIIEELKAIPEKKTTDITNLLEKVKDLYTIKNEKAIKETKNKIKKYKDDLNNNPDDSFLKENIEKHKKILLDLKNNKTLLEEEIKILKSIPNLHEEFIKLLKEKEEKLEEINKSSELVLKTDEKKSDNKSFKTTISLGFVCLCVGVYYLYSSNTEEEI